MVKRKRRTRVPKMTILALLAVAMVLLIVLVVWLVGMLTDSGDGGGKSLETSVETTKRYDVLTDEENELVVLVEDYRDEMLASQNLTVKAGEASEEINLVDAGAPVDFTALKEYIKGKRKKTDIVDRYRSILANHNIPEYEINEDYIYGKLNELNAKIDTGMDSYYTVEDGAVTVYRGKRHTVIDVDQVYTIITVALKTYNYNTIEANIWMPDPKEPDWDALYQEVYVAPQDAKYQLDENGLTRLVSEVSGVGIDIDTMKKEYNSGTWVSKTYYTTEIKPAITTENINDNYFKDVLGSKTSYYSEYEKSRTVNVKLATNSINGYVVLPGDKFSFNKVVGERTEERGYQNATIYVANGVEPGLGGGICQVSSTLYNATLYANLKQFSRYYHAFTVSYVDLGFDATVYWGSLDYVFINNTNYPIKISAVCKDGALTIKILGTKEHNISVKLEYEVLETYQPTVEYKEDDTLHFGETRQKTKGRPGYKVQTYKTVTIDGVTGPKEKVSLSNYSPINDLYLVGPGTPTGTVTEAETTAPEVPPPAETTVPPSTATP